METTPSEESRLLFENVFEVNDKDYREYIRFKRVRSVGLYVSIAFFAYLIGSLLYYLIVWRYFEYLYLIYFVGFIALDLIIDLVNRSRRNKMLAEQTGGKPYKLIKRFYEDRIEYGDSLNEGMTRGEYSTLRKLRETKNLMIVSSAAKLDYSLKKDAFTVGSAEDFKAFINRKLLNNR